MTDAVIVYVGGKKTTKQANLDATGVALSASFTQAAQPYVSTTSNTYATVAHVIFAGTNILNTVSEIDLAASTKDTKTVDFRIYDVTNNQTIAEYLGFSSTTVMVQSMGTISNLPATQAVWAIQARKAQTGAEARVHALIGFSA